MTTLEKLGAIERTGSLYSINYRNAGVGFTFYEGPQLIDRSEWKTYLKTYRYYPDFEQAVDGEFRRIFSNQVRPMAAGQ